MTLVDYLLIALVVFVVLRALQFAVQFIIKWQSRAIDRMLSKHRRLK